MRYKVVNESGHGCCFTYSVVDTTKIVEYTEGCYETVCESDEEGAKLICDALNNQKNKEVLNEGGEQRN